MLGFETIGAIRTLDATQLSDVYKETADLISLEPRPSDMCRILNTRDHYVDIETIEMLSAAQTDLMVNVDLSSEA